MLESVCADIFKATPVYFGIPPSHTKDNYAKIYIFPFWERFLLATRKNPIDLGKSKCWKVNITNSILQPVISGNWSMHSLASSRHVGITVVIFPWVLPTWVPWQHILCDFFLFLFSFSTVLSSHSQINLDSKPWVTIYL